MSLSSQIASLASRIALQFRQIKPSSPTYTRDGITGKLSRIDYANGDYKVYNRDGNGVLLTIVHTMPGRTVTKTFVRVDGKLTSVPEVVS